MVANGDTEVIEKRNRRQGRCEKSPSILYVIDREEGQPWKVELRASWTGRKRRTKDNGFTLPQRRAGTPIVGNRRLRTASLALSCAILVTKLFANGGVTH
jgi:hypothetical protein